MAFTLRFIYLCLVLVFVAQSSESQSLTVVPKEDVAIAALDALPYTLSPATSTARNQYPPYRPPTPTFAHKALSAFAEPGYGLVDLNEQGKIAKVHKIVLVAERATSLFDGATTYAFLNVPRVNGEGYKVAESDPLLTLFGNRSKGGILGSGAFLELLYSEANGVVPVFIEKKMGPKAGKRTRLALILAGCALTELHVQLGVQNLHLRKTAQQAYRNWYGYVPN